MDHVTDVFEEPVTTAVNCCGAEADVMVTLEGASDTVTVGFKVTVAEALLVASATLVAVTVTVC
jgi:hypothetical protein